MKNLSIKKELDKINLFVYLTVPKETGINMQDVQSLSDGLSFGCLPCAVSLESEQYLIRYKLASEVTIENWMRPKLRKKKLIHVLTETVSVLEKAREQGLSVGNFVLDKRYIYIDVFSKKLYFIYLPVTNNLFQKISIRDFIVELMFSAPYDEQDDLRFYMNLQNFIAGTKEITIAGIKKFLRTEKERTKKEEPAENETDSKNRDGLEKRENSEKRRTFRRWKVPVTWKQMDKNYSNKKDETFEKTANGTDMYIGTPAGTAIYRTSTDATVMEEDGGTTVLSGEEEGTTVLDATAESEVKALKPYLISKSTGERVIIYKDEFKIGRDPRRCDHVIDNDVVGRYHAKIFTIEGEYYLEDISSLNGTFVNGIRVRPGRWVKIKHGDKVTLANEWFIFRMY